MSEETEKTIDFSKGAWKEMLIGPRFRQTLEDTLQMHAAWLGLKPGMTVVDMGSGLGYMGYTFWPCFGERGYYIGVDISEHLLRDSRQAATLWADGGSASFLAGDAYAVPLADNIADAVMCQTLLLHLEKPESALAEMIRVAKPGGVIICQEPDNLATLLTMHHISVPDLTIDERMLLARAALLCNRGRKERGFGDTSVGCRVPHMMRKLGLVNIRVRINDRAYFVEPPYEGDLQQFHLDWARNSWLNEEWRVAKREREEQDFLAGGGELEEFHRYCKLDDRIRAIYKQQITAGEFYQCGSGDFYITRGRKLDPRRVDESRADQTAVR